jgi:hypothetical protein
MPKAAAHFDAETIALMKGALDEAWSRLPPKLQAQDLAGRTHSKIRSRRRT